MGSRLRACRCRGVDANGMHRTRTWRARPSDRELLRVSGLRDRQTLARESPASAFPVKTFACSRQRFSGIPSVTPQGGDRIDLHGARGRDEGRGHRDQRQHTADKRERERIGRRHVDSIDAMKRVRPSRRSDRSRWRKRQQQSLPQHHADQVAGVAPSAARTPSSRVRLVTANAITP